MSRNLTAMLPLALIPLLLTGCSLNELNQPLGQRPHVTTFTISHEQCGSGCPTGGSDQTLFRAAYILNNNSQTKFANWVAYKITRDTQESGRTRNWRKDPDLANSDTLSPAAYDGANAALKIDRGHQAPLAGLGNAPDWPSLNYLSNITPQKSSLNQGAWARLEDGERKLANRSDISAVYVVTGPLFNHKTETLPAAPEVHIPSAYWKIIYIGSRPDKGKYAAFLMNQDIPRDANFCDYQTTIDLIEQKTTPKLTVWSDLPENIAREIKENKGTLTQELGCTN
jgi:endonuclease G, mitochondrial